jgi:transposase
MSPTGLQNLSYQGHCPKCGDVASSHPLKMSEATGAAQVQLGPRALALAATVNKKFGCTLRSTCRILQQLAGLRVTPGGIALALQRVGKKVEPSYQRLVETLRKDAAVFVDETSWYVGEPKWWLWAFTNPETTVYAVYAVEANRSGQVVTDLLGADFDGMLISDCLASYESLPYRKHKCIAHHLKAIKEARGHPDTPDETHLDDWKVLFQAVIGIWRANPSMDRATSLECRRHLEEWLDRLLIAPRTQPGDVAIQKRIGKRRDDILGCLDEPAAEPTNNRAERALRPAVIARKLSCGNKTVAGKTCFEILISLATTCAQRGHDFVTWLADSLPLHAEPKPIPSR